MNWTCAHCKNDVDEGFDICWSCGASFDGLENPHFCQEIEATKIAQDGVRVIECDKCGYRGESIRKKVMPGLVRLFCQTFLGIYGAALYNHACPKCGETRQIYDWKA